MQSTIRSRITRAAFILSALFSILLMPLLLQAEEVRLSETVDVVGRVRNPLVITTESIRQLKVQEKDNTSIVCDSGQTKKVLKTFKGVLLRDVLDAAGVAMETPRQRGEYYVLVRSTDNYNVLFAYNELYYAATGDNTWLVFEENGNSVLDDGRFVVFSAGDRVSGPRHVKWVDRIEVGKVEPVGR